MLAGIHLIINSWILDIQEAPDRPVRRETTALTRRTPGSALRDTQHAAGSAVFAQTRGEV
jgi:hypothetical protein